MSKPNPLRSLTSLKNTPTYKPLPRRQHTGTVEAPWLASSTTITAAATAATASTASTATSTTTTTSTTTSTQPPTSSSTATTTTSSNQVPPGLTIVHLDAGLDQDLDQDEEFDPFAVAATAAGGPHGKGNRHKSTNLLGDDYDDDDKNDDQDDDDDEDDDDDDDDDEEAQLRRALKQIQQEREREKKAMVKAEMFESGVPKMKDEPHVDKRLLSNPLLAGDMLNLIKAEAGTDQHRTVYGYGGALKSEQGLKDEQQQQPSGPVKRKKWTQDSLFSNTALAVGDSSNNDNKKQRLNNDTINTETHVGFMNALFK